MKKIINKILKDSKSSTHFGRQWKDVRLGPVSAPAMTSPPMTPSTSIQPRRPSRQPVRPASSNKNNRPVILASPTGKIQAIQPLQPRKTKPYKGTPRLTPIEDDDDDDTAIVIKS